ncbi:MAG TPA: hypothetical protein VGM18_14920 [Candidatus Sulfotelmatobacter sp.]|jgi:hypothetical protein
MLQAHSILWHYLWVAPNILLLVLGFLSWQRRLYTDYPVFFAFAVISAIEQLIAYAADVMPSVTPHTWWLIFWACLVVEGLLKFALIGEIFAHAFDPYPSIAKHGKILIRSFGIFLVFTASIAASRAPQDSLFGIVNGAHLLQQAIYLIESGLLVFIFAFLKYFRLSGMRATFGIALGLAVSACVHLATWAVAANSGLPASKRPVLDFLNMLAYHACVLIWFYYLLVPAKAATKSAVPLPENDLDLLNRELERLVHP